LGAGTLRAGRHSGYWLFHYVAGISGTKRDRPQREAEAAHRSAFVLDVGAVVTHPQRPLTRISAEELGKLRRLRFRRLPRRWRRRRVGRCLVRSGRLSRLALALELLDQHSVLGGEVAILIGLLFVAERICNGPQSKHVGPAISAFFGPN